MGENNKKRIHTRIIVQKINISFVFISCLISYDIVYNNGVLRTPNRL